MIQRLRNYTKSEPKRDARKIYLICEGTHTEPEYFKFFRAICSNISIIPIPAENNQSDPCKLIQWAENHFLSDHADCSLSYMDKDMVWFVIDTDTWLEQGKIAELTHFCQTKNAELVDKYDEFPSYDVFHRAQSNPMFELWYYYHVYSQAPDHEEVKIFSSFKDFVDSKYSGGFNAHVMAAYVEDAITNAERNFKYDDNGYPSLYSTEVYQLCKLILPFVKKDVDRLKRKISL